MVLTLVNGAELGAGPGLRLRRTLRPEQRDDRGTCLTRIAWSANGHMLAVPTQDGMVELWDAEEGVRHLSIAARANTWITSVAWSPEGSRIAAAAGDGRTRIWRIGTAQRELSFQGKMPAWSLDGRYLATVDETTVALRRTDNWKLIQEFEFGDRVTSIAFLSSGRLLTVRKGAIDILEVDKTGESGPPIISLPVHTRAADTAACTQSGERFAIGTREGRVVYGQDLEPATVQYIEGHTRPVQSVSFSHDGALLASKSLDNTVRILSVESLATLAVLSEPTFDSKSVAPNNKKAAGLAFHPTKPILATLGEADRVVRVWDVDMPSLLGSPPAMPSVRYTTARIVLVGDSGVGKTGLGWVLAHGRFKEQASSHGQQFWVLDSLRTVRDDGTECEAVLWDLAGQADYRLTHTLFLDSVDMALLLFDPGNYHQPLKGVEYWVNALGHRAAAPASKILVAARVDRAGVTLSQAELDSFCEHHGIDGGFVATSAAEDIGLDNLLQRMTRGIAWDKITTTVTTTTFKRIKEFVLTVKESEPLVVLDPAALESRLQATDPTWNFSTDEMMAALEHLATHGYVAVLRGSSTEQRILLSPEMLSNLAASLVLEARRNPTGLGALEEDKLLNGHYSFGEVAGLDDRNRQILLDSVTSLFLERNICFRERLGSTTLLVFPSLINQKMAAVGEITLIDDVSYTVKGRVENVYAALVVLLGYTNTFSRTNQWQNQAQYEVGPGEICGFRQVADREGEVEIVLQYASGVGSHVRSLFQGLVEAFLRSRDVTLSKYFPAVCHRCGYRPDRVETVKRLKENKKFLYCGECGANILLTTDEVDAVVASQKQPALASDQRAARRRTNFESALARLKGVFRDQKLKPPICFISYAWGVPEDERTVLRLSRDLEHAEVQVLLDRKDNAAIGSSIAEFVNAVAKADFVAVIGTPEYLAKYEMQDETRGSFVAAEMQIVNQRLTGPKIAQDRILPVLLRGEPLTSFPPLVRGRLHASLNEDHYFMGLFDVILKCYGISPNDESVSSLRESLLDEA